MRRLIVVRHAKSSWRDHGLPDHDRPLQARGRRDAPRVAAALRQDGYVPDLVYCSPAVRTRETWGLMASSFGGHPEVKFVRRLYLASRDTLLASVRSAPPEVETLMVVGHNPASHAVASGLARSGEEGEIQLLRHKLPTGTAVVIDLTGERWEDMGLNGKLVKLILPRRLE